ncbi:cobalamin-5'-phosphate synthase [Thauera chlorobenzoica]|nr:cobalamin-5'-phosphate synthase [Thauera chlorobenzoica]
MRTCNAQHTPPMGGPPIHTLMRYQLELFFTALGFFTRLPVPAWVPWSTERLNHAARYFPLVGWVVGALGAVSYLVFALALPPALAVILSMAVTIRATGAFHEDGFADACDGLGGGWDKAQVLTIMKDSRIGSYGTVGIVLMLLAKAAALLELAAAGGGPAVALALFVAHPLSRLASTSLIHLLPYVREDETAKSKPLAKRLTPAELAIAAVFGLLPLAWLAPAQALAVLAAVAGVTAWAARMFVRRLGGYTGDLLGALQQAAELACYVGLLAGARMTAL